MKAAQKQAWFSGNLSAAVGEQERIEIMFPEKNLDFLIFPEEIFLYNL